MSPEEKRIVVYRFRMVDAGREIAPQHMWGTVEAMPPCTRRPIPRARAPDRSSEQGFSSSRPRI